MARDEDQDPTVSVESDDDEREDMDMSPPVFEDKELQRSNSEFGRCEALFGG